MANRINGAGEDFLRRMDFSSAIAACTTMRRLIPISFPALNLSMDTSWHVNDCKGKSTQ